MQRCRPLYGEQSVCCSILKLYFHTPYLCVLYDSYNLIYSYGIVCEIMTRLTTGRLFLRHALLVTLLFGIDDNLLCYY